LWPQVTMFDDISRSETSNIRVILSVAVRTVSRSDHSRIAISWQDSQTLSPSTGKMTTPSCKDCQLRTQLAQLDGSMLVGRPLEELLSPIRANDASFIMANEVSGIVNRLDGMLISVRKDIADVTGTLEKLKSVQQISPNIVISSLHTERLEILDSIFQFCCEEPNKIHIDVSKSTSKEPISNQLPMPIVLSSVCSYWRQVIFQTHAFWTSVSFTGQLVPVPLLEMYRDHSGSKSVSLTVDLTELKNDKVEHTLYEFVKSCPAKWKELHFLGARIFVYCRLPPLELAPAGLTQCVNFIVYVANYLVWPSAALSSTKTETLMEHPLKSTSHKLIHRPLSIQYHS
jgi:hypothetical protein